MKSEEEIRHQLDEIYRLDNLWLDSRLPEEIKTMPAEELEKLKETLVSEEEANRRLAEQEPEWWNGYTYGLMRGREQALEWVLEEISDEELYSTA